MRYPQFILLLIRKLPEVNADKLRANGGCKVFHFLCSTEQSFLVWVCKVAAVGDINFCEGFPGHNREVGLSEM
jgi:hypothetical protein